jgi:cytidyltransferase-like protein
MADQQKLVLAGGCFDLVHIGHFRYLEAASKMGRVVVGVTRNDHVNKGPGMPIYDEQERLEVVKGIRYVADAILVDSSFEALNLVQPDIFVKGREYKGRMLPEDLLFCEENDVEIRFTNTEEIRPRDRLRQG